MSGGNKECSTSEVIAAFDDLGLDLDDPKVIDSLCGLADINFDSNAETLSTEFMAFMFKKKRTADVAPTMELIEQWEKEVLNAKKPENTRKIVDVTNLIHDNNDDDEENMLNAYGKRMLKTPDNLKKVKKGSAVNADFSPATLAEDESTPNSRKYQSRTNKGSVVAHIGGKMSDEVSVNDLVEVVKEQNVDKPYRFMFETLRDKAGNLDETICRLGDLMANDFEDFSLGSARPEPFLTSGRICCDSPDVKINQHSILLQGGQDLAGGATIPLDISRLKEFSLFPGQVVGIEGINPNGNKIIANKIIAQSEIAVEAIPESLSMSLMIASGPYTTSDNLGFAPLADLLSEIKKYNPDLAVLVGPFLDARHDLVSQGSLEEPYQSLFENSILKQIFETASTASKTKFVLVSSQFDAHLLPIYPTPSFVLSPDSKVPSNVNFVSDPCTVEVNGLRIGLTATDILFHLGKEEISFKSGSDRLGRLARHVVQGRSFYPLYPPNEEVNIDFEQLEKKAQMDRQPHLLVLPSDLVHFVKDINGGLVLNPGRLAKREGGGVYLRMQIRPKAEEEKTIMDRISAEIVRI